MIFRETPIPGAFLIELEPHRDERGSFARSFCAREFAAHGLDARVVQCNLSRLDPGHGCTKFSLQDLREHQIKRRHRSGLRRLEQGEEEGKRGIILLSARIAIHSNPGGFEPTSRRQSALRFVTGEKGHQCPS